MNQHFNLTRFTRLLRKHTAEHVTSYALGAAVLLGGMLIVMGFITFLNSNRLNPQMQAVFFTIFLLAAGSYFTSTVMAQYGAGRQAALALTLPASQLEKFLVAWLFSLPIFLVVFGVAFYLADWLILHVMSPENTAQLPLFSSKLASVVGLYLALHGVGLWGGIFFERLQPVKIAFLSFSAALVVGVLNYRLLAQILGAELHQAFPFGTVVLDNGYLELPEAQTQWLSLLPIVLGALLWAASYARLTEKQL
jgi:hypothetical protein